ncbi:hypothetical protein D3C80_1303600 [compost metagenome]
MSTRPFPPRPPTSSCPAPCGWKKKAPLATPSGAPSSGTSWSAPRARPGLTSGNCWNSPSASPSTRCGLPNCWPKPPNTRARPCTRCCSRMARSTVSRSSRWPPATRTMKPRPSAFMCKKACSRSMRNSVAATATTWPTSTVTTTSVACAGRWSTARKRSGVTVKAWTRMLRQAAPCSSTATPTRRRLSSPCPTSRPPKHRMPSIRSGSAPAACWSTGTPAP